MTDILTFATGIPHSWSNLSRNQLLSEISDLSRQASVTFGVKIACDEPDIQIDEAGQKIGMSLHGVLAQCEKAKTWLRSLLPLQSCKRITASGSNLYDSKSVLKPNVLERLNEIEKKTGTKLISKPIDTLNLVPGILTADGVNDVYIEITGDVEAIEKAQPLLLVYLDELAGHQTETIFVDASLHHLLAGRYHHIIHQISITTRTSIYLSGSFSISRSDKPEENKAVYITSPNLQDINLASSRITSLLKEQPITSLLKVPFPISDGLSLYFSDIQDIMYEEGVSILFTPNNELQIVALKEGSLNQATLRLYNLLSQVFIVHINVTKNIVIVPSELVKICSDELTRVSFSEKKIEIVGSLKGVQLVMDQLQIINTTDVQATIYLSSEYEEFITGKKNGKFGKISKSCHVYVSLLTVNDVSVSVSIQGSSIYNVKTAMALLRDEYPAENRFFIPEQEHRRIIGAGGKNIQVIMKQYGVYVKFYSNSEFQKYGGIRPQDKNVLVRTPYKNKDQLEQIHYAIIDLLNTREEQISKSFQIARCNQTLFLSNYSLLETKSKTRIEFTRHFQETRDIIVHGTLSNIESFAKMINEMMPLKLKVVAEIPISIEREADGSIKCNYDNITEIAGKIKPHLRKVAPPIGFDSPKYVNSIKGSLFQEKETLDDVKLYPETKLLLDTKLVNEPKPSLLEKLLVDKQAAIGSETKRSEMKNLSTVMQQKTILFDDIPSLKSSMEMKSSKLEILLDSLNMKQHYEKFQMNEVDFEMFLALKEEDFKELGFSLGARKTFVNAISEIKKKRTSLNITSPNMMIPPALISPQSDSNISSSFVSPNSPWPNSKIQWAQGADLFYKASDTDPNFLSTNIPPLFPPNRTHIS